MPTGMASRLRTVAGMTVRASIQNVLVEIDQLDLVQYSGQAGGRLWRVPEERS